MLTLMMLICIKCVIILCCNELINILKNKLILNGKDF